MKGDYPNAPRDPGPWDCTSTRAQVARHLDGELGESEAVQLRGHLLSCPGCRAQFQGERQLKRWFVPVEGPAVPAGFAARVAALATVSAGMDEDRVGGEVLVPRAGALAASPPTHAPDVSRLLGFTTTLVGLAAAALLVLSLALALDSQPSRPTALLAEPLPEALERLEELNRAEREGARAPGSTSAPLERR